MKKLHMYHRRLSGNPLPFRGLRRQQERLHEVSLTANRHSREFLVPEAFRDFRLAIEPLRQQLELTCIDAALLNSIEQMPEQRRWDVLPANARQGQIP